MTTVAMTAMMMVMMMIVDDYMGHTSTVKQFMRITEAT